MQTSQFAQLPATPAALLTSGFYVTTSSNSPLVLVPLTKYALTSHNLPLRNALAYLADVHQYTQLDRVSRVV